MAVLEVKTIIETQDSEKSLDNLDKGIGESTKATEGLSDSLDSMTGGAITGFKKMVGGVKNGVVAMKTLKGAIAATGIGALLIAITALTSYFTKTQAGADILDKAMAGIGATIDVLIDRLSTFGSGLFEILVNGNFSEGLDILKGSFAGIGDEILRESKAAQDLEVDFQNLAKRKIDFIVTEAKLRAETEAARLASEDFTKSAEERNKANERAIELTQQLANENIAQTKEELRILTAKNSLGESLNEDLESQRILEAELFNIETDRDSKLKELLSKQKSITDELTKQKEGETNGEDLDIGKIESKGFADLTPEDETKLQQQDNFLKKQAEKNKEAGDFELSQIKDRTDRELDLEAQKESAKQALVSRGFQILSLLSMGNAKRQKGLAAAQATFDTFAAIVGQLKSTARTAAGGIPGFAIAQAIATGVFGLVQVKKILSTDATGGTSAPSISGGGGGGGGARPSQSNARIPDFGAFNQGVGGGSGLPSNRAVVVNQDIRDSNAMDNRVSDLIRLGK